MRSLQPKPPLGLSRLAVLALAWALGACSSEPTELAQGSGSSEASKNSTARPLVPPPVARPSADPNPLALPPLKLDLAPGTRVFAVPEAMLRGAKAGTTMHLRAANVTGKEGDNLVIDGRDGPDYAIHPSYVIPITPAPRQRLRPNQPVVAEWAQTLRHGVVRRYVKDRVLVRFTDTQDKGERQLDPNHVMPQTDGFRPGNYAAYRTSTEIEHVLLVSPVGGEPKEAPEWLVFGYGGAARVVKTTDLIGVPISYEPKPGSPIVAEHLGKMREGVVKDIDRPGVITVLFERAGRPVASGWGLVMPSTRPK